MSRPKQEYDDICADPPRVHFKLDMDAERYQLAGAVLLCRMRSLCPDNAASYQSGDPRKLMFHLDNTMLDDEE